MSESLMLVSHFDAALMMRLETLWTISGYPAIAFCFMASAAIAGGILVWRVIINDHFK